MDVFYCLIHSPEAITPELCVLSGFTEAEAVRGVNEVARDWPRLERIDLYRGNAISWFPLWPQHVPSFSNVGLEPTNCYAPPSSPSD